MSQLNPFDEFPKLPESLKFERWTLSKSAPAPIPQYQAVEFDGHWFSIPRGYDWGEIEYEDESWGCSFDPQDRKDKTTPMQYLSESGYEAVYDDHGWKERDILDWQLKNRVVEGTRVRFAFKITETHTSGPDGDDYEEDVDVIILEVLQPDNELELITQLCEDARNIGFCECGNWRGDSALAKKWNTCQRCAEHKQAVEDARDADPLYDAREYAIKKLYIIGMFDQCHRLIRRANTQEELDQIIKQAELDYPAYLAEKRKNDWLYS